MRRILLFLLLFASSFSTAQATDVSGPVSGVWSPSGNPYNVVGEIRLLAGQTLTIQPGVQVIFQGHYSSMSMACYRP